MGVFGTRPLIRRGWYGRLNLSASPPGCGCAALHRRDDRLRPGATATTRSTTAPPPGTTPPSCSATSPVGSPPGSPSGRGAAARSGSPGLHTGHLHNRVYGTGRLLLNCSYPDSAAGQGPGRPPRTRGVARGAGGSSPRPMRTHRKAGPHRRGRRAVTRLEWLKRGLPRSPTPTRGPGTAGRAGRPGPVRPREEPRLHLRRHVGCRASGRYTVVLGPGDLARTTLTPPGSSPTWPISKPSPGR